jgi:hypothetical protein
MCLWWIDRCDIFTEAGWRPSVNVLGAALANGNFDVTLPSGCSGTWAVALGDLDPAHPMGTTPDPTHRAYLFTRAFAPRDTAACHAQFGAFVSSASPICSDSWAVHLLPQ